MLGQGKRAGAALLALVALVGCRYQPSFFPVRGTSDDRSQLVGEWYGEFTSTSTDRNGFIGFHLEPGRDSASGDVSVLPRAVLQEGWHHDDRPYRRAPTPTGLRIGLLRVDATSVEGFVEPFQDPDCSCMVSTWSRGVVRGYSITGEYVSRGGSVSRRGTWRMRRQAAAHAAGGGDSGVETPGQGPTSRSPNHGGSCGPRWECRHRAAIRPRCRTP